jgi:hypothetical protein
MSILKINFNMVHLGTYAVLSLPLLDQLSLRNILNCLLTSCFHGSNIFLGRNHLGYRYEACVKYPNVCGHAVRLSAYLVCNLKSYSVPQDK